MEEDFYAFFRKQHPKPYFNFPEIFPADTIHFERLLPENAEKLFMLFKDDCSPFVDERFKTIEGVNEYAEYLKEYGAYSPKHGSADWLFKIDGDYAGVVHLFDMSLETVCNNHKRAWIGFAVNEQHRRLGITSIVVKHFINTIFNFYPAIDFIHSMTDKENKASIAFLRKCGFLPDLEERMSKEDLFFILSRAVLS